MTDVEDPLEAELFRHSEAIKALPLRDEARAALMYYCERAQAAEAALEREKRASDVESEMLTLRYQAAEAERDKFKGVVVLIASKKCLNGNSSCDWPCVVCIARAALGEEA